MTQSPLTQGHVVNFADLSRSIANTYSNKMVAEINESCLRFAVITGEYPWHSHPDSDELFIILEGELFIDFEDSPTISLKPQEMIMVPAGVVHRTRSLERTVNLCFEHTHTPTVMVESH